jgi:hypothetical protein
MSEFEEREMQPLYLMQRIDNLEWLFSVVIGTFSQDQRDYIEQRLAEYSRNSQDAARRRDTDPARDQAEIVYDLEEKIRDRVEESVGAYEIMRDS